MRTTKTRVPRRPLNAKTAHRLALEAKVRLGLEWLRVNHPAGYQKAVQLIEIMAGERPVKKK